MAKVEITVPGERIVEEFTALVPQPTSPSTARPPDVGLVELSYVNPTELIPGPPGPPGPRGSLWTTGDGDPTDTTGNTLGDMYLDDVTGAIWTWNGEVWVNTGTDLSPDASELLLKLITVDGAGSGLDADLLDGQDGTWYLDRANHTNVQAISTVSGLQAALDLKAPIASPTFTGDPKAPTPAVGDNDTSLATTAFVTSAVATGVGTIPPFPEAPLDGQQYVRQSATWQPVDVPPGTIISDTAPSSPEIGQLWWESDTGALYIWYQDANTTQWVQVNGGDDGGSSLVVISDTKPLTAESGQLWWESDTGRLFTYYTDANTSQWVQISGPLSPDHISSATYDMWAGFTTGDRYILNDQADGAGRNGFYVSLNAGNTIVGLDKAASGDMAYLVGTKGNLARWALQLADANVETGSNAGSNFSIGRYTDAGAYIDTVLSIARTNSGTYTNVSQIGGARAVARFEAGVGIRAGLATNDELGSMSITSPATGCNNHFSFVGPANNVGIATRNIAGGAATHLYVIYYNAANGSITTAGSGTAFNTTSDMRLKKEVREIKGASDARAIIDQLMVIEYIPEEPADPPEGHVEFRRSFRAVQGVEPAAEVKMIGMSAQQAYSIYPPAVTPPDAIPGYKEKAAFGDEDFHPWMIDHSKFVPMLIANIQELNARNDALEARLAALEAANAV